MFALSSYRLGSSPLQLLGSTLGPKSAEVVLVKRDRGSCIALLIETCYDAFIGADLCRFIGAASSRAGVTRRPAALAARQREAE